MFVKTPTLNKTFILYTIYTLLNVKKQKQKRTIQLYSGQQF
jgi:hypothetical protein